MKRLLLIFAALLLTGCLTPITNLEGLVRKEELERWDIATVDSFLKTTFTDEAYEVLKDIPVYVNPIEGSGCALCTSKPSYLLSLIVGAGFERSIIISESILKSKDGLKDLSHEFLHHLDDMTRDGDGDFIDVDEFYAAYLLCEGHSKYHGIFLYTESAARGFFTDLFGIGEHSERIAFAGECLWWRKEVPPDLKRVYRKIFRNCE